MWGLTDFRAPGLSRLIDWLSSVLRPRQHSTGYLEDGFTGQKTQPTVSKHWRNKNTRIKSSCQGRNTDIICTTNTDEQTQQTTFNTYVAKNPPNQLNSQSLKTNKETAGPTPCQQTMFTFTGTQEPFQTTAAASWWLLSEVISPWYKEMSKFCSFFRFKFFSRQNRPIKSCIKCQWNRTKFLKV